MKLKSLLLVFVFIGAFRLFGNETDNIQNAQNLAKLKESIQRILNETNTPGAGVVILSGDSTILCKGFGKADMENIIDVNENTIFRFGSLSKIFVALAILKLQEERKLSVKDKIKDIIPEIQFENTWEDNNPIRIEHLLEHTSGWSYWHFAELGSDDPKPKTLKESLEYYPKSRISDFVPGTRIRESNVGSAVAAYIIEKVTGQTFEAYVEENFFKPMGMHSMSFFYSKQYVDSGAVLYDNGNRLNYFHILYRPAAALNGSLRDMEKMMKFINQRGKINNRKIISDSSMQRWERLESMPLFSKSKLFNKFGMFNFKSDFNGFTYHQCSGSVPGGNATIGYLPEFGFGYAIMINENNKGDVLGKIEYLIKNYQTKDIKMDTKVIKQSKNTIDPSGYYIIINAKMNFIGFIDKIKYVNKLWIRDDTLNRKFLLKSNKVLSYIPIGNNEFCLSGSNDGYLDIVNDPLDGQIIVSDDFYKKISPLKAYFLITIFWAFYIVNITVIVFALLRVLIYIFGKEKNTIALWKNLWPFITTSFLMLIFFITIIKGNSRYGIFQLFGTINFYSVLIYMCGICYALFSFGAVYYTMFKRTKMSKIFYIHSILAVLFNLIFTIYFVSNGLIGIPTWG